ncbi:AzlC family ABC transporter permease [Paramaledivibacter caminithermalis]|jgi:4-azaleucine resistance transporter AzlC|uniref:4-azaleucine resistance probable transporter AzlC n=1 Tax=Paramaledivibacter caminithermalis (strain DSM 15212 / CIP 107654 / DViRD3) TaxID=1121301 RepID=A0A1M6TDE6_PARC5|nr:AzlC family ABC transporter permease [Paramaledivibacter caminithermalis]SHK54846.1 4-azaleucine resistance probable transporter AzlC [Paramaledivibacter caminithermalis DSM 15212]
MNKKNFLDSKKLLFRSFIAASPVCIGYLPLGLACGILAAKVGLSPIQIALISIIVFAGSAQFISISMISTQASVFSIIIAVFVINLRHLLLSSTLSKYFDKIKKTKLLLFAHGITDETFAINYNKFKSEDWDYKHAFLVNITAIIAWVFSNTIGGLIGPAITIETELFSYALTAMFIALLSFQLKRSIYWYVAFISGVLSVVFSFIIKSNLNIIIATLIAVTIAYYIDVEGERKKNNNIETIGEE